MADGIPHPRPDAAFDASDPDQVKKRESAQAVRELEQRRILQTVLESRAGRDWLWGLLSLAHVFQTSFAEDTHRMAFKEGERSFGLRLLAQITAASPDAFVTMMQENGTK